MVVQEVGAKAPRHLSAISYHGARHVKDGIVGLVMRVPIRHTCNFVVLSKDEVCIIESVRYSGGPSRATRITESDLRSMTVRQRRRARKGILEETVADAVVWDFSKAQRSQECILGGSDSSKVETQWEDSSKPPNSDRSNGIMISSRP